MKAKTKNTQFEKIQRVSVLPRVQMSTLESHFKPEEMPLVDASPLGRHRLIQAFRNKYGPSFRNVRGVAQAIKEYDIQVDSIKKLYKTLE